MKDWTRSETLALALEDCATCEGLGMVENKRNKRPCNCVLRGIFRLCYNRFRYCADKDKHIARTTLEVGMGGKSTRYVWGRKEEEYAADFFLVSRRNLEGLEWDIFRFHFLLGADWRLCCLRLKLDRGTFFHHVYRMEQRLGRVFRELKPYALYPLDEYFGGTLYQDEPVLPTPQSAQRTNDLMNMRFKGKVLPFRRVVPVRAPLLKTEQDGAEEQAA